MADNDKTIDVEVQARVWAMGNIQLHNDHGEPDEIIGLVIQMNPDDLRKVASDGPLFRPLWVRLRGSVVEAKAPEEPTP